MRFSQNCKRINNEIIWRYPKIQKRVGATFLNLAKAMLTKVFKVKDTKTNAYGCCDQCGGCQCNN